jgi:hypothetical protein
VGLDRETRLDFLSPLGPVVELTGGIRAEMDRVREFYQGMVARDPDKQAMSGCGWRMKRSKHLRPQPSASMLRGIPIAVCLLLTGAGCSDGSGNSDSVGGLSVATVGSFQVGSRTVVSSTQLLVAWTSPSAAVDHYQLSAIDGVTGETLSETATGSASSATLSGLKSGTSYSISLRVCRDVACSDYFDAAAAVVGTTAEEYWEIHATGDGIGSVIEPLVDGNVRVHAVRFGADAPAEVANRVQLYYGPALGPMSPHGLSVATTDVVTGVASVATIESFTGTYGVATPDPGTDLIDVIGSGAAVPLSASMGGAVRLMFEAKGADSRTRIMYIDSTDGWVGRDYNSGSATLCQTTSDYSPGGPCEPTVAIGVDGDTVNPTSGVQDVRQFKVGYPTLDDWRWDGTVGTFVFVTLTDQTACGGRMRSNQGYAVWDGTQFTMQFETASCPTLIADMQAPSIVHLGDARYKVYFGTPSVTDGMDTSSFLPFLGPKRVMYATGSRTGDATVIDFSDWEEHDDARDLHFLWPSGELVGDTIEGYLDDFVMLTPSGDLDFQIMYTAMTDGTMVPIIGIAILVNP